jgi:NAD(P)H-dependent FMN reductase
MYHGSYSSVVKTALDYCSIEALSGTTVGLVTVSGGGFPTPALEHLRASCLALETEPVPNQVAIPDSWDRIEDGTVTDDDIAERLATLGRDVVRHATSEGHAATAEAGVSADD